MCRRLVTALFVFLCASCETAVAAEKVLLKPRVLGRTVSERVGCKFSPDGRKIAAYTSKTTYVWNVADGKQERVLNAGPAGGQLSFSEDNKKVTIWQFANPGGFLVSRRPITLREFDLPTGKRLSSRQLPYPDNQASPEVSGAYSPSRREFVVAYNVQPEGADHYERTVIVHGLTKDVVAHKWVWRAPYFSAIHFRPGPRALVAFSNREGLFLWDLQRNRELAAFPSGNPEEFQFARLSRGGNYLAIGTVKRRAVSTPDAHKVTIWHVGRDNKKIKVGEFRVDDGWDRRRVYLSPDGQHLFLGQGDFIHTWDVASGRERKELLLNHPGFTNLAALEDTVCTVGGPTCEVRLWNLRNPLLQQAKNLPELPEDPLPPGATARFGSARLRHGATVYALRFSKDGKRLFSASGDHSTRMWDVASGKQLRVFSSGARDLALSPDDKFLVAARLQTGPIVWEVKTGKVVRSFEAPPGHVRFVAMSPDGTTIYAAGDQGVKALELDSGRELRQFQTDDGPVAGMALSSHGRVLAAKSGDRVHVWHADTGERIRTVETSKQGKTSLIALSPDGRHLAVRDGGLRVWDVGSGELLSEHRWTGYSPSPMVFSAVENRLWIANLDFGLTKLVGYDWRASRKSIQINCPWLVARSLALSPDGKTLAVGGRRSHDAHNYAIRLFDVESGHELKQGKQLLGTGIVEIELSSDGQVIATNTSDDKVTLWDVKARRPIVAFKQPGEYNVRVPLALSPDRRILACGAGAAVTLFEAATGKELGSIPLKFRPDAIGRGILCLKFSPDGNRLAVGNIHGGLSVIELAKRRPLLEIQAHGGEAGLPANRAVRTLDVSPQGKLIVTAGADGAVRVWSMDTVRLLREWNEQLLHINSVRFSPDGTHVVAGGEDDRVVVWEVSTGETVYEFRTDSNVTSVDFCARGRVVVAGHADNEIKFWDLANDEPFQQLKPVGHCAVLLRCSPDGRALYTASSDSTILAWDLEKVLKELAPLRSAALREPELDKIWNTLTENDAVAANRAIWRLAGAGTTTATRLFRERLPLGQDRKLDEEKILAFIRNLSDDKFHVREAAFKALKESDLSILRLLKDQLRNAQSEEVGSRLASLVNMFEKKLTVATIRAIQVLEYLATPESLKLLEDMAEGVDSLATHCAQSALARLKRSR